MKIRNIIIVSLLALSTQMRAGDIFVSAGIGNDKNDGSKEAPLKTIEQALKQAREWRRLKSPEIRDGINIIVSGGIYTPVKPIYIRPEDSGTKDSPTKIKAAKNETVVISGGISISQWKEAEHHSIPSVAKGKVYVTCEAPKTANRRLETRQLWTNGKKAIRATQFGADAMERMIAFNTNDESITIPTPTQELSPASQLEMLVHQRWATAILRVREMKDLGNGQTKVFFHQPESQIEFSHPWPQPIIDGERGNSSFALMNAIELLDEPGEWYQDNNTGLIYYHPQHGEDPNNSDIIAPALTTLLDIDGTRERLVEHISFENISFMNAAWMRPSFEGHVTLQGGFRFIDGYKLYEPGLFHKSELENQAWIARPESAVAVRFASNINFTNCTFAHTGATALDFEYAVSSSTIQGCHFEDIGGTAILAGYFGEKGFETHIPYTPSIDSDLCSDLTIRNCSIHDAANEDWGCVAIGAGYVKNILIEQNKVSNVSYSGICVGWGWTALESGMCNNRIINNNVQDYAMKLYDAGGIYTLSNQPNSLIKGNTISAPYPAPYATNHRAFSIYFDEATDGFTVEDNNCPDMPFGYNKPGPKMVIRNNGPKTDEK